MVERYQANIKMKAKAVGGAWLGADLPSIGESTLRRLIAEWSIDRREACVNAACPRPEAVTFVYPAFRLFIAISAISAIATPAANQTKPLSISGPGLP